MQSQSTQSPLLPTMVTNHHSARRPLTLATLIHYLHRLRIHRLMRDSLLRVRVSTTEYLEQRQTACWPVIIFSLIFNLAFIVASICIMITSLNETPQVHLRVWIVGYAIKCGVHGICLGLVCKRRLDRVRVSNGENPEAAVRDENSGSQRDGEDAVLNLDPENVVQDHRDEEQTSVAKHLDSADTVLCFIWWIIGFYWIYIGGQNLTHDSPQLYWLCITFLVFDAFIVVICVAAAFVVGLAVCFCLPCMLSILYVVTDQEDGIEDCIQRLPKYKFQRCEKQNGDSPNEEIQESPCGKMTECNTNMPTEHVIPLEDAVCCICLCTYEEGKVLRRLPCRHHFHSACIVRWLYLNPPFGLHSSMVISQPHLSIMQSQYIQLW